MSMSTFGFIAHALRPSTPDKDSQTDKLPQDAPQTVTGNSYSVFTTKNYVDNEMYWFWMVLICALLLFTWWKLRRFCRCPGPSKEDERTKRQAKWNRRQLEEDQQIREKTGGHKVTKKLPGPRTWGKLQCSRILEWCRSELRQLGEFMVRERISLPGSSNVVAVSYKGTAPDLRRARLVREKQPRDTTDRMECGRLVDVDALAWADRQRSKNRGHHGQVGHGGTTDNTEHPLIAEVRRAALQQKEPEVSNWVKEQEQEPEETQHAVPGQEQRHHEDPVWTPGNSTRDHRASWAAATAGEADTSSSDSEAEYQTVERQLSCCPRPLPRKAQ